VNLDQVIRDALRDSLSLKRARTKVDAAKGKLLIEKSAFDWTALAQSGWQRFLVPKSRNGVLTDEVGFVNAWRTQVGVTKEFSNGISMSPGVITFLAPGKTVGQTLGATQTVPTLNFTVPLMRGLGGDAAEAGERAATATLNGTRFDYDYATQRTVHDVVQIFWQCIADAKHRMVMLETDQEQTDFERWLRAMAGRGQIEPTEVKRAEAQHSLNNHDLDSANEGVLVCRRRLSDAVGLSAPAILEPVGDLPHPDRFGPAIARLQVEPLVTYALDHRQDLRALKAYVEASRDKVKGAEDKLNPQVDVVLDPYQAFVRFSRSFSNTAAKGAVATAMADQSDAEIALRQGEQGIRSDIANAVLALKQLWLDWPSLIGAQRKFESLVDQIDSEVHRGTAYRRNLRAAQDDLARSEHATIEARLRLASIVASLRLYTGAITLDNDKTSALTTEFSTFPQP
ncbi:MAG: TolC family protein, partial [Stellaceae bacterium]